MQHDEVIVLDFGSQYNQLITRRIREFGVYSELKSHKLTAAEIKQMPNVKGIIFSGSPNSVTKEGAFTVDPEIFNLGLPILGICYGMQLTTHMHGGTVERAEQREYGKAEIEMHIDSIKPGQKVILVDDLIATGGTTEAIIKMVEELGGEVVKIVFLMELAGLKGRERLSGYDIDSAIIYEGK